MRKTIVSLGLIGAALAAAPASAQGYYGNGYGYQNGYNQPNGYAYGYNNGGSRELWRLNQQVNRAIQRGDLDRREAYYFQSELQQLRYLDQRYAQGGYNGYERQQLDQRIDRLRERLRYESNDGDRRDGRWGDRDGRDYRDRY